VGLVSVVQVVRRLLDKPSARVVIVFLRVEDAGALLMAIEEDTRKKAF